MHVRVCRDCGEEYRPEITVCSDCGGVLEDRHTDSHTDSDAPPSGIRRASESEQVSRPDLTGHRPVFQTRQPREIVPAAELLREAGLAFLLVETPLQNDEARSTLALFVREEDASSALQLLAPLYGPDAAAYSSRSDDTRCPACDAVVAAGTAECPDCGLVLSREPEPGEDG
jgi:hypothetical protein